MAEPKRAPTVAKPKPKRVPVVAKAAPERAPAVAKATPKPKPIVVAKTKTHHVVKPNETLHRVGLRYDMSVEQLKRLNRMKPGDDTIRAGQRLQVSG